MPQPSLIPKPEEETQKPADDGIEMHRSHTLEDDMALAMDATDPAVIQQMMEEAREKEDMVAQQTVRRRQRKSYIVFAILFLVLASAAAAYGYWRYRELTVPLDRTISVGVFPQTAPIGIQTTDIRHVIKDERADATLSEQKPTLVNLVTNETTQTPLSVSQFFQFVEANPSEPFAHMIDSIRLGVMNTGTETSPFIILSVPNPEVASKEFLIAEPQLVHLFYTALGIDIATYNAEAGGGFESKYLYNLPVRILNMGGAPGEDAPFLLYGYAADNIMVITTKPAILKEVYDTIVRQR